LEFRLLKLFGIGVVHKGRPQRRGAVALMRTGEVKGLVDVHMLVFLA